MNEFEEIKSSVLELNAANEAFRKQYDEKLQNLSKQADFIEKKIGRPGFGYGGSSRGIDDSKQDLAAYIRSRGETKGMFSGSDPAGGWTVSPVLQEGIGSIVRNASALRKLVNFINIEKGDSFEE